MYEKNKAHPWHGISPGDAVPEIVTCFIEIVPGDTVKYEIDKSSGYLKIDRPQLFSNTVPALYGFIPQTYCGEGVAAYCSKQIGKTIKSGDRDPLDICVLSERSVTHGDILVRAIPIGGLRLIDKGEVDDKIIAVLYNDAVYRNWHDITDCPDELLARLRHYFLTYKTIPGETASSIELENIYGKREAHAVIQQSIRDYHQLMQVD
jgi:inorganic pyrophosphatase